MKVVFRSAINNGGTLYRSFTDLKEAVSDIVNSTCDSDFHYQIRDMKSKFHWNVENKCCILNITPIDSEMVWTVPMREQLAKKIMEQMGERFRAQETNIDKEIRFLYNGFKVVVSSYIHNRMVTLEVHIRI